MDASISPAMNHARHGTVGKASHSFIHSLHIRTYTGRGQAGRGGKNALTHVASPLPSVGRKVLPVCLSDVTDVMHRDHTNHTNPGQPATHTDVNGGLSWQPMNVRTSLSVYV